MLELLKPYISGPLNLIDVGCHKGHFKQKISSFYNLGWSFGIDPCFYGNFGYTYHLTCAISEVEGIHSFYEYIEPGCNSLLPMKVKNVVHDRSHIGWFVGWPIEKQTNKREVWTTRLDSLIKKYHLENSTIDFLKIDTQGHDISVVKSLGAFKARFVQMECVSSHKPEITLYEGQQIMERDIEDMKQLGYEVLCITDYSVDASPEADVLFYCKELMD